MKITNRDRVRADLAAACATDVKREDDILATAINSNQWSQLTIQVRDHRDANGHDHAIACHRNH